MKIISQAPTRISLFGGSTDLPIFYEKYGGLVINLAINLRMKFEINIQDWEYDVPDFGENRFYNAFFNDFNFEYNQFRGFTDAPIRSGLGSSAAAGVALVAGLSKLKGQGLTKQQIAERAWTIEVNKIGLYGGKQDQYAAAFGGMNTFIFGKFGTGVYSWPNQIADKLAKNLLLFYTGESRKDGKIQERFKKLSKDKVLALSNLRDLACQATQPIKNTNIVEIAKLLRISWEEKRRSNNVSNSRIDNIYRLALDSGALAGKLNGSGGGGFMTFLVELKNQSNVIKELEKIDGVKHYDFSIDYQGVETRILP